MSSRGLDERVTAALLEHVDLPDLTDVPTDRLFNRLARVPARRAEAGVDGVAYLGELRRRGVTFEVITERCGIATGTAHRWSELFDQHTTSKGEQ